MKCHLLKIRMSGWQHKTLVPAVVYFCIALIGVMALIHDGSTTHTDHSGHGHGGHGDHEAPIESSVELSETAVELGGLITKVAQSQPVVSSIQLMGKILPNQDQFAHINARFPGVVKNVYVNLGETVKIGQRLATVEANGSLSRYAVTAKMPGVIVGKEVVQGEFITGSKTIFEIANLETVWLDLIVPETDLPKVKAGQKVVVKAWESGRIAESTIKYVSPMVHKDSQTVSARVVLKNQNNEWRPGLFIEASVVVDDDPVAIAVERDAVQVFESENVVFVQKSEGEFEARPVVLGKSSKKLVEIKRGLSRGETYVAENSYILKADLLKSQAEHVH